ncbi:hypothetical protein SAMN05216299_11715 [Nitrosospira sp. Nsp14]|nr:hypothetical protein SAMN05216299_11715 [Nitrosospira sp. Nsp14]
MPILEAIMSYVRRLFLLLIMLGLPLQGALAAIMPLCTQAKSLASAHQAQAPHGVSSAPCSQHETVSHEHSIPDPGNDNYGTTDRNASAEAGMGLPCDGVVCHISGAGLLPAAAMLNLAGARSYPADFNSRFISLIPEQPQHPPLALPAPLA